MRRTNRAVVAAAFLALALPAFVIPAGCGTDWGYLLPAITGQVDILQQMVPVEEAIASGRLTDAQLAKLRLIGDARTFAGEVIGLNVGDNYATFYDSRGEPVAFNLSASRKDAFVPQVWTFPLVGTVPYLGFFNREAALKRRDELVAQNLDVFIYQIDAYSGLGFYPNPILSPMLERSDVNLVDTVIHELLHATIWRPNDTSFNESLATFYGRAGAMEFFRVMYPDDAEFIQAAEADFEDVDRYAEFALELFLELDAFYSSSLSREEKIAGRAAVYAAGRDRFLSDVLPLMNVPENYAWVEEGFPVNNAWMLGIRRYNLDLGLFEEVFEEVDRDWAQAKLVFAAAAGSADPYAFLRDWRSRKGAERARMIQPKTASNTLKTRGLCPACLPRTVFAASPG